MPQSTYFVNCPHCGEIVEVVCPQPDRRIRTTDTAKDRWNLHFGDDNTNTACRHCGKSFVVYWYFK
jgi:hypothetical protein